MVTHHTPTLTDGNGRDGVSALNVTKPTRARRRPEIDAYLGKLETVGPDFLEREYLEAHGFGDELQPTRWRASKLSARAKAALLDRRLRYLEQDAAEGRPLTLQDRDGRTHPGSGLRAYDLDRRQGLGGGSFERFREQADEGDRAQAEQLRRELGPYFGPGLIDREAQVRKWEQRRKSR